MYLPQFCKIIIAMLGKIKISNLDDHLLPPQACSKPVESKESSVSLSLSSCLTCASCLTSAETLLLET